MQPTPIALAIKFLIWQMATAPKKPKGKKRKAVKTQ